jgi:Retrotransposon gag protein/Zinc knuckle
MNPQFSTYGLNTYHLEEEEGQGSTSQTAATNDLFHDATSIPSTNPSVEQLMAMMLTLMQGMQEKQGSQGNGKAPFKLTVPDTYNGIRSPKVIDTWLFSVREYCDLAKVSTDHDVSFAASLLRDNAKAWWRSLHVQGKTSTSFKDFEDALRTAFRPSNALRTARNQLAALQQTGSVQAYVVRFRDLTLEITDLSEAETLDRFIRGLRDKTRLEVEKGNPSSLEEAIEIAERFDSIVFGGRIFSQNSRVPYRPSYMAPNSTGPTPMEVDELSARTPRQRLDDAEKADLRKRGACFVCKQVGHIARNCPEKPFKPYSQPGNDKFQ